MRQRTIEAGAIEFAYVEQGEGPLVLLLHGFPDDAHTWSAQLDALAQAGYRAVAPFMRGYAPTGPAPDGRYDVEALAGDVAALVDVLGDGPAHVVGHDWGAVATQAAMLLHPDAIERAVTVAVGHPRTFAELPLRPRLAHHAFHTWLFALGDLGLAAAAADDMALIDYLWRHWSPGHDDGEHVARLKREAFGQEGALAAALAYYPALVHLARERPELAAELLGATTAVPTLAIFGGNDPGRAIAADEERFYSAPYRREIVAGSGHFVHREKPDEFNRLLLGWLAGELDQPRLSAPTRSE